MSRTPGTADLAQGVQNPKSGRAADGKLVLWTEKGEPRIIRPISIENRKLFVDAEAMLSLGAHAELELPALQEEEVRTRVRVEVVYSNPGKGSTTLRRGMLLAFPEVDDALFARVQAALEKAPRSGPLVAVPERPKSAKDDDTVYSKVPVAEPAVQRPAPEAGRRAESTRTNGSRRAQKPASFLWILLVFAGSVAAVFAYLGYEDWLDRGQVKSRVGPASIRIPSKRPATTPTPTPFVVDPRYTSYLTPAREAAAALGAGDAAVLEAKLEAAEKALAGFATEPASLRGLRAGRVALRLRDTALDNIGQARTLEGVAWGKGSSTPYRTKESFLKAQDARISMTKSSAAELAEAMLAILNAADPWRSESDAALSARIERTVRMLDVTQ